MISYEPFWKTIKNRMVSTYALREKYNISSETLHRMKNNKAITTTKIDDLCNILNCEVEEIIKHVKQNN